MEASRSRDERSGVPSREWLTRLVSLNHVTVAILLLITSFLDSARLVSALIPAPQSTSLLGRPRCIEGAYARI
jgi:hypothetical protein